AFIVSGRAITGDRVSQPTYSASGATFWSTLCRSPQASAYRLCTIRSTTRSAAMRGFSFGFESPEPQPAATSTTSTRPSVRERTSVLLEPELTGFDRDRKRLGSDAPLEATDEVLVRQPEPNPVRELKPRLPAKHVHLVDPVK